MNRSRQLRVTEQTLRATFIALGFMLIGLFTTAAFAQFPWQSDKPEFLPVDQAFRVVSSETQDALVIDIEIEDGYYLYKDQFSLSSKEATFGSITFPQATLTTDEFFGETEVYFDDIRIKIPIEQSVPDAKVVFRYQGCAEAGLCYPPTSEVIFLEQLRLESDSTTTTLSADGDTAPAERSAPTSTPVKSQTFQLLDKLLDPNAIASSLVVFFLLGLGLAFTPCVFPMYPIIAASVLGNQNKNTSMTTLGLSFVYVQGMAITYSALGLIAASAGAQLYAVMQQPLVLSAFVLLFILLATSMFGAFTLQLPSRLQNHFNQISQKQASGRAVSVFIMGVISAVIASPCTTAPLSAALLFIAQSGDALLGFATLYALSLGMGVPLIVFALGGHRLLPKAGSWMVRVKHLFGFMMLSVALIFLERLLDEWIMTGLWMLLLLTLSGYLVLIVFSTHSMNPIAKAGVTMLAMLLTCSTVIYGWIQFGASPSFVLNQQLPSESTTHPEFTRVRNLSDLESKLQEASQQNLPVMLDLYADWCVACKEFEKYTFPHPAVIQALDDALWMQIDLTENTPDNLAFQEHFAVTGLPTILFFDRQGNEIPYARVTGFMNAEEFAKHVEQLY